MFKIRAQKKILDENEKCAFENSRFFAERDIRCFNMISSPGSGKTTILARAVSDLRDKIRIGVIEGDIRTDIDSRKIRAAGAAAFQIETRGACHLSAAQVTAALHNLPCTELDVIFIENVGNLVCPSAFELGEHAKIVVLSVPEGDDKPAKYPAIFAKAKVLLVNKIDLTEHVEFDLKRVEADARKLNPHLQIFPVSAKTGQGMLLFYEWLFAQISQNYPPT
jgi:hydrogenase nickel incorporation protein HypB